MPEVEQSKEVKVEKVEEVSVEGKDGELEDEWVDILGSGDLKKKVCWMLLYYFLNER